MAIDGLPSSLSLSLMRLRGATTTVKACFLCRNDDISTVGLNSSSSSRSLFLFFLFFFSIELASECMGGVRDQGECKGECERCENREWVTVLERAHFKKLKGLNHSRSSSPVQASGNGYVFLFYF